MIKNITRPRWIVECFKCKCYTDAFDSISEAADYAFTAGWTRKNLTGIVDDDWRCPACNQREQDEKAKK